MQNLYLREFWKNNLALESPLDILLLEEKIEFDFPAPEFFELSSFITASLSGTIVEYTNNIKRNIQGLSEELQNKFYEKNVEIYSYNLDTASFEYIQTVDNFEAYDLLSLKNKELSNYLL